MSDNALGRAVERLVSMEMPRSRDEVDALLRDLGLVAIDPALVQCAQESRRLAPPGPAGEWDERVLSADAALADTVLEQLGAKP
jgi:hypothetical protein